MFVFERIRLLRMAFIYEHSRFVFPFLGCLVIACSVHVCVAGLEHHDYLLLDALFNTGWEPFHSVFDRVAHVFYFVLLALLEQNVFIGTSCAGLASCHGSVALCPHGSFLLQRKHATRRPWSFCLGPARPAPYSNLFGCFCFLGLLHPYVLERLP